MTNMRGIVPGVFPVSGAEILPVPSDRSANAIKRKIKRGSAPTLLTALLFGLLLLLQPHAARAEMVWAIQNSGSPPGGIYTFNAVAGGPAVLVASTTALVVPSVSNMLAAHPTTGLLYFYDQLNRLYTWNPGVPSNPAVLIGTTAGIGAATPRLAFDATGRLFAGTATQIAEINPATAGFVIPFTTHVPAPGGGGDICFNSNTGLMYLVSLITGLGRVSTVDITAGPTFGNIVILSSNLAQTNSGCQFDGSGNMIVSAADGNFYTVNPITFVMTVLPGPAGVSINDLGGTQMESDRESHEGGYRPCSRSGSLYDNGDEQRTRSEYERSSSRSLACGTNAGLVYPEPGNLQCGHRYLDCGADTLSGQCHARSQRHRRQSNGCHQPGTSLPV